MDIRRHLKNSNRPAAMKLLRKKKLLEREHEKKEGTIDHLNTVLTQIEQTDCSSLVKSSTSIFNCMNSCLLAFSPYSDHQCLFIRRTST